MSSQIFACVDQLHHVRLAIHDISSRLSIIENGHNNGNTRNSASNNRSTNDEPTNEQAAQVVVPQLTHEDLRLAEGRLRDLISRDLKNDVRAIVGREATLLESKLEQSISKLVKARIEQAMLKIEDDIHKQIEEEVTYALQQRPPILSIEQEGGTDTSLVDVTSASFGDNGSITVTPKKSVRARRPVASSSTPSSPATVPAPEAATVVV